MRVRHICSVKLRDKATGELLDLPNHVWPIEIAAIVVQAGRYWWVRLLYDDGSRRSQWELIPSEKIREYSGGLLG